MRTPDSNFYHSPLAVGQFELSEEESHHATKVCRAAVGDTLRLCDGEGHFANAKIVEIGKKACTVEVEAIETIEKRPHLNLGIACLKDDGNEEIALHTAEADLANIILFRTDYSQEPKNASLDRVVRRSELKARVSLKQSMKAYETKIVGPVVLKEWLKTATGTLVLCDIDGQDEIPANIRNSEEPVTLLVGPEGGFSPEEITAIKSAPNAKICLLKLGNTRLRARTAALFAIGKML